MPASRFDRMAPWAGIAFVVLSLTGAAMMLWKIPDPEDSDAGIMSYYGDSGSHVVQIIGDYLWTLAAVAFLWFVVHLWTRLRRAEGEPGNLSTLGSRVPWCS